MLELPHPTKLNPYQKVSLWLLEIIGIGLIPTIVMIVISSSGIIKWVLMPFGFGASYWLLIKLVKGIKEVFKGEE